MNSRFAMALSAAFTLLQTHSQSFSGLSTARALTTMGVSASIDGLGNSVTHGTDMGGGGIDIAATLNPGSVTFDHLNYTGVSSETLLPFTITRTDPNTFQMATYSITFTLNPFSYTSFGNKSLSLTPHPDGGLGFDTANSFTVPPPQLSGTIVVDGPNQDLNIPFSTSAAGLQPVGFTGSIYVPNYPASITIIPSSAVSGAEFNNLSSSINLFTGTIDGFPFVFDLSTLSQRFEDGFNTTLTAIPEPDDYPLVVGLGIFSFGLIRSVSRVRSARCRL
jgi:hypothetical protein